MEQEIVNKIASSGLITIDLEKYLPSGDFVSFDLKDHLFMGLILKEKDFREKLKSTDWSIYSEKYVAINCTADAIIPSWAYMLLVTYLQPVAKHIFVGTETEMYKYIMVKQIASINVDEFKDQRIVVKGCGDTSIDSYAFAEITRVLLPHVKSIMYGEPCSTVPVFKRK